MLTNLRIKNFAIIDNVDISFQEGMSVITGETGSGKSILIDAINIVLGARATKDKIRTGNKAAYIEVTFNVERNSEAVDYLRRNNLPVMGSKLLKINKEIFLDKSSQSYINDVRVTNAQVKELSLYLVDIFGQHETQMLLDESLHKNILDNLGDDSHQVKLTLLNQAFTHYAQLNREYQYLLKNEDNKENELDFLYYQKDEINKLDIENIDEEKLLKEHFNIKNVKDIEKNFNQIIFTLDSSGSYSVIELIRSLCSQLLTSVDYNDQLKELYTRLDSIRLDLADIKNEAMQNASSLVYDEQSLFLIEEKLDHLNSIKAKYGRDLDEVKKYLHDIDEKIEFYENYEQKLIEKEKEVALAKNKCLKIAKDVHEERIKISKYLEGRIVEEMGKLNISNPKFKVDITKTSLNEDGYDSIKFLISTNIGEDIKPLAQVASGGEMSRIMLALKSIVAERDSIQTLIFDEIDTGISGETARVVAEKILKLSENHQIIIISHLPQIVSVSTHHFHVNKDISNGKTFSVLEKLNQMEREVVLSQLIFGKEYTPETLEAARKMLNNKNSI